MNNLYLLITRHIKWGYTRKKSFISSTRKVTYNLERGEKEIMSIFMRQWKYYCPFQRKNKNNKKKTMRLFDKDFNKKI